MKYAIPFVGLIAAAAATGSGITQCAADNCLRAVRATAFPTRPGTADCISYFLTTLTPDTVTITETSHDVTTATAEATVTVTVDPVVVVPVRVKREVVVAPSDIPAYASACSGAVRYSSACSCIGITGATTTVDAPLTTVTITTTDSTTTATNTATLTATSCHLRFSGVNGYAASYLASKTITGSAFVVPTASLGSALTVVIQPDGSVTSGGKVLVGQQSTITTQAKFLLWVTPSSPLAAVYSPVTCSLDASANFNCVVVGTFTKFGAYTGADHPDTLRLFDPAFIFSPSIYRGPLYLKAIPV
ncbi:hypothetical protein ABW20_dc0109235 [Dactylellina cionopaga]|nr:hypothetical protein ABW20_dc0109235 [Dactylellina cionopaga]